MPTTDSPEARLAARREAARQARTTQPAWGAPEPISVGDLQVGDYLVRVDQDGVRPVRYDGIVTDLVPVNAGTQVVRGERVHSARGGIALRTSGAQVGRGALVWSPAATATVRRQAVA